MKVVLSTVGKFHTFNLARELDRRGNLLRVFSGYPRFKLSNEGISSDRISTFPVVHAPYMAMPYKHAIGPWLNAQWEYVDRVSFGRHVARSIPECDVYSGMSASGLEAGRVVKKRQGIYMCDRGSSHIRAQDEILRREHDAWGIPYRGIDPRIILREEEEYQLADMISVPSEFAARTFIAEGIDASKIRVVPYGVQLDRFAPVDLPDPSCFSVVFAGQVTLRKGIPYLLEAFSRLDHPNKLLTIAGRADPSFLRFLNARGLLDSRVRFVGSLPQSGLNSLFSRSDVLVLPSVEDGFGLVLAEAMASGCPVIASRSSGGPDLINSGVDGFVVETGSSAELLARLQDLADAPEMRLALRTAAVAKVNTMGGWTQYGQTMSEIMQVLSARNGSRH
ncbi:D-inositol 3-phosphate glycosyltransferase [Arthrobacter sp. Bi26]|uniref:glycosyltransferase family 4 protein n=1 Tax=Arthrobacter sp. Bi26 TaxID=2822350 RepID=UPI001E14ED8B|nr:glycosyltransferase family 4 protein [Arthrobacter sp. Bi26]CAH0287985.1 D-inositol 3-phosphate glycosyltransferase [Arthrobacter sp. Bi26]